MLDRVAALDILQALIVDRSISLLSARTSLSSGIGGSRPQAATPTVESTTGRPNVLGVRATATMLRTRRSLPPSALGPARPRANRSRGSAVKTQRLRDGERGSSGENLDVCGGQHTGVFGDDGPGRMLSNRVEVGLAPGARRFPRPPRRTAPGRRWRAPLSSWPRCRRCTAGGPRRHRARRAGRGGRR